MLWLGQLRRFQSRDSSGWDCGGGGDDDDGDDDDCCFDVVTVDDDGDDCYDGSVDDDVGFDPLDPCLGFRHHCTCGDDSKTPMYSSLNLF
mgnify:CR=1 FL=1